MEVKEELDAEQSEIAEKCSSEEDLYQLVCGEMLPKEEELTEDDLKLVVGGISKAQAQALKDLTAAYYQLVIQKRKRTTMSADRIRKAANIVNEWVKEDGPKTAKTVLKWAHRLGYL